jgi:hypothetical protein
MGKGTKRLENIFIPTTDEINQGYTINAWHVSQSVNAFTGTGSYDIDIDGSLTVTGSIYHESAQDAAGVLSNVVVRNNATGEYFITGSYGGGGGGSGTSGSSGSSGTSGSSGSSGTSGSSGNAGTSGSSGSSGTSGSSGIAGDAGTSGSSGSSGTSGSSGSSGAAGTSGSSGSSGTSGSSGIGGVTTAGSNVTVTGTGTTIDPYVVSSTGGGAGTSGSSGSSGTSGSSGSSGTSGSSGDAGTSGSSGSSGTSGSSGVAGDAGTSGSSGTGQAIEILDNGSSITTDVESINFVGATITEPTADNVTVTITGGGGSQDLFNTASVANNGVIQAPSTFVLADAVNDQLIFDFANGVSGSTDPTNDKIIISSEPTPQLYLRKDEESGSGGSQTVPSNSSLNITWKDGSNNYKDNTQWFALGANNYFEYDPNNSTTYFKILLPGLYEFDLQLKTVGNLVGQNQSSQLIFNRGSLVTPPNPTFIETIGMGSYIADSTIARKVSTTFYVSQDNIDIGENYFYVSVATSVDLGATAQSLSVGGGGSTSIKGNYCSVKFISG